MRRVADVSIRPVAGKRDLKAFIESLSEPNYDQSAPKSVPSGLKPGGK